jgi:hypothetical protein
MSSHLSAPNRNNGPRIGGFVACHEHGTALSGFHAQRLNDDPEGLITRDPRMSGLPPHGGPRLPSSPPELVPATAF